ncbi:MAG: DUF488 domain-containing protein [Actinomycetota bacterium]|nr:DUF488 domain-containing protein [Actinomycetota bacterium]
MAGVLAAVPPGDALILGPDPLTRGTVAIFTVGHGARAIESFVALLRSAGVRRVVDVRTAPGSRKHPQFGRDALAASLPAAGIEYVWRKELGGWRRPRPDSRHTGLTSPAFRGYADHMETAEFRETLSWLIETFRRTPTAIMCAESLWWRCHRRMLADALSASGCEVRHVMEGGRLEPHRPSPSLRVENGDLVYDVSEAEQQELL